MYFKKWITKFKKEDSAIGDLARDVGADRTFPRVSSKTAGYQKGLDYLYERNAMGPCIETYSDAWNLFHDETFAVSLVWLPE